MSLHSAFGQWDATAHQPSPPFDVLDRMRAQGASGVGGTPNIHQKDTYGVKIKDLFLPCMCCTQQTCAALAHCDPTPMGFAPCSLW
jgi:hypothetical protein